MDSVGLVSLVGLVWINCFIAKEKESSSYFYFKKVIWTKNDKKQRYKDYKSYIRSLVFMI